MARAKFCQPKRDKFEKATVLIWGTLEARGLTVGWLAEKSGVPAATLYRRKKSPGDFTLSELGGIGRALEIQIDEFRHNTIAY